MDYDLLLRKLLKDEPNRDEALMILKKTQDYMRLMNLFQIASKVRDDEVGRVYKIEGFLSPLTKCTTNPPCKFCRRALGDRAEPLAPDEIELGVKLVAETGVKRIEIGGGTVWNGAGQIVVEAVRICRRVAPHLAIRVNVGPSLTYEDLVKLRELGVAEVSSNFETMNRRVFNEIKPGDDLDSRIDLARNIDKAGLGLSTTIMVGIGSGYEDYVNHLFWLKENIRNLSRISITILRPIKGTPLGSHPMGSLFEALKLGSLTRLLFRRTDLSFGGIANEIRVLPLRIMAGDNREVHLSVMVTKHKWNKQQLSPSEIEIKQVRGLWYYNALPLLTRMLRELGMEADVDI